MKKIILTAVMVLLQTAAAISQQRFVSFDTAIPTNWQTNADTPLALSTHHVKSGGHALKWEAKKDNWLKATGLAIPATELDTTTSNAQIFIYSPAATNDTLLFQFFDETGALQRQGKMLLNFKGWLEFHRSYFYDYADGIATSPAFSLSEMQITYKPVNPASTCVIHIDEATIIGDKEVRIPGPQVWPDYGFFRKNVTNAPYLNVLPNWKAGPDLPVVTATPQEIADLNILRGKFKRNIDTLQPADLPGALAYVAARNITTNPDGSLNGTGIPNIYTPAEMVKISGHCASLARKANKGDADALAKLLLFTEYLLSEGMAEGSRIVLQTNAYTNPRIFPVGFLEALPYYPPALRAEVVKMLKWANEYSVIYGATFMEGYSVDYLNLRLPFLIELALAEPDDNVAVRDLKMVKRFMERNTVPGLGGRDGMKPDGVGYHHGSQHTSYMGAWGRWIEMAYLLKGTVYKMDLTAYENMSIGLKYLLAGSSKGVLYAHAESGRNPFPAALPVSLAQFEKFVEIGGDIKGVAADPVMGGIYNDVTGVNKYAVPPISMSGFHQYNYGVLGIQRKNNWVAVMRGFTSKIFGAEIYTGENRYGRYQSYGTLEVLYGGTLAATGYILAGKGWDWHVMPGTTTVHFESFAGLKPKKTGTAMEFQNLNYAGSLSLGGDGIFGFNFNEMANGNYDPSRLRFKKSVFAFDSILVCLGSNIAAINGMGNVATNLFQAIDTTGNPAIYVNSTSPVSATAYDETFEALTAGMWLMNAQTTGYYIPKGNDSVRVVRGLQSTPRESVSDLSLPNAFASANASKAWITHGKNPAERKYHFVVVPGTTPAAMQVMAGSLAADTLYHVLRQTDTMHVVKYNPSSLTAYVFFKGSTAVNTGLVKSVSDVSLVGIREKGDSLIVTINTPDMDTRKETAYDYYWRAYPRAVTLVLNGYWDVVENPSGAAVTSLSTSLTASFSLQHGFAQTIKLVKHADALRTAAAPATKAVMGNDADNIKQFRIYPNPAKDHLEISFVAAGEGMALMKIMNMAGAVMQSGKVQVQKGQNRSPVNVSGLLPGTYIVLLTGGTIQEKGLFVKH